MANEKIALENAFTFPDAVAIERRTVTARADGYKADVTGLSPPSGLTTDNRPPHTVPSMPNRADFVSPRTTAVTGCVGVAAGIELLLILPH
jgi:hypothetical protein